jgi:SAM-dependent methyltransferase
MGTAHEAAGAADLERARTTWDTIDIDRVRSVAWSAIPYFQRVIWRRVLGEAESIHALVLDLLAERLRAAGRTAARGVALVCGDMAGERRFFEDPRVRFERVDGYDISVASLGRYRPAPGMAFVPHVEDVNAVRLEEGSADLVVGWHGLHHVRELDRVFLEARRALRPGGLLVMYEWIGPRWLQLPWGNRIAATALLYLLFPSARERTTHMGVAKGIRGLGWGRAARRDRTRPKEMDPSEACNSEDLLPAFLRHFRPVRLHPHAALTYPMFEGLAQNLDPDAAANRVRFAIVQTAEDLLGRAGLVKPLFAVAVGEPR